MKYILLSIFLLLGSKVFAQDTLYMRKGEVLQVKIFQITSSEVTYYKFSNPNGPKYVVMKSDVEKIVYENGVVELINSPQMDKRYPTNNEQILDFKRNIFGYNYFDMLFKRINVNYERLFGKEGGIGAQIGFAAGITAGDESTRPQNTYWSLELAANLYPLKQRRLTYFLGPMFVIGEAHERIGTEYQGYPYYYSVYRYAPRYYVAGYFTHGLRINIIETFGISFVFGLGARYNDADNSMNTSSIFKASVNYMF